MDYRDTLSAELPAPRDDEPAGVRDDIVDELADHLACAYNRELLRGADAHEARRRVFERFGDPAAVARRLWFDAMGGKIMAQRVLLATCLAVSLASLCLAGAMWIQGSRMQRESARAATEALRALTLQNGLAQAGQLELAKQLRAISEEIKSARSLDWNPVTFQLKAETPDGPPAAGFSVTFSEEATVGSGRGRGTSLSSTRQAADPSGIFDFGLVHPGNYTFKVEKHWIQGTASALGQFFVHPGSKINKTIVCPKIPPELEQVRIRTHWPADLEKEALVLYAAFALKPVAWSEGWWTFSVPEPEAPKGDFAGVIPMTRAVLCGPGFSMTEIPDSRWPNVWPDLLKNDLRDLRTSVPTLPWERGTYSLAGLLVIHPLPSTEGERMRQFEVVLVSSPGSGRKVELSRGYSEVLGDPPTDLKNARESGVSGFRLEVSTELALDLPGEYWSKTATAFEARPVKVNQWTIPLPDELLAAVRESLKAAK